MTRSFSEAVCEAGAGLTAVAGSYLHSVTLGDWPACHVCALPTDGYRLCIQCGRQHHGHDRLADRAGFLVYADMPGSQTYRVLRGYKESPGNQELRSTVRGLLGVGLRAHFGCAKRLSGLSSTGRAVVPSSTGRSTFRDIVRSLTKDPAAEIVATA